MLKSDHMIVISCKQFKINKDVMWTPERWKKKWEKRKKKWEKIKNKREMRKEKGERKWKRNEKRG